MGQLPIDVSVYGTFLVALKDVLLWQSDVVTYFFVSSLSHF